MPAVCEVGEYPLGEFRSDKIPPPQQLCFAVSRNWHSPHSRQCFAPAHLNHIVQRVDVHPPELEHLPCAHPGLHPKEYEHSETWRSHRQELCLFLPREDVGLSPVPALIQEEFRQIEGTPRQTA